MVNHRVNCAAFQKAAEDRTVAKLSTPTKLPVSIREPSWVAWTPA
jgi:hypothetical protein